jgi:hypothetical protein
MRKMRRTEKMIPMKRRKRKMNEIAYFLLSLLLEEPELLLSSPY